MLAVANTGSCFGSRGKIGHRTHRYRQLMQVPVLRARGITMGSKACFIIFSGFAFGNCRYNLSFGLRKKKKKDLWYEYVGDKLEFVFSPDLILCVVDWAQSTSYLTNCVVPCYASYVGAVALCITRSRASSHYNDLNFPLRGQTGWQDFRDFVFL